VTWTDPGRGDIRIRPATDGLSASLAAEQFPFRLQPVVKLVAAPATAGLIEQIGPLAYQ